MGVVVGTQFKLPPRAHEEADGMSVFEKIHSIPQEDGPPHNAKIIVVGNDVPGKRKGDTIYVFSTETVIEVEG